MSYPVNMVNGVMVETHGMRNTIEYDSWANMAGRVKNPKHKNYAYYSALEHDNMINSFEEFYAAIGPRPSTKYSIDRIDNTKGYVAGNVRWATQSEQMRNTARSATYYVKGYSFGSIQDAADYHGVSFVTIWRWVNGRMEADGSMSKPPKAWAWKVMKYGR